MQDTGSVGRGSRASSPSADQGWSFPETFPEFPLPPFRRSVIRREDLLVLDFEFVNLRLDHPAKGPRLIRSKATDPAFLVVHFPPQSFAEQSFFENTSEPKSKVETETFGPPLKEGQGAGLDIQGPPVRARIAGPSRLAFRMPTDLEGIDYTLADLLAACRTWEPSVVPVALPTPPQLPERAPVGQQVLLHHLAGIESATQAQVTELIAGQIDRALRHELAAPLEIEMSRIGLPRDLVRSAIDRAVASAVQAANDEIREMAAGLVDPAAVRHVLVRGVGRVVEDVGRHIGAAKGLVHLIPGLTVYLTPSPPAKTTTAIELPYRLFISPNRYARWVHAVHPVDHGGSRTELWHTRLGILDDGKVTESEHPQRAIRAVWSPDYRSDPKESPSTWGLEEAPLGVWLSLLAKNRHELVHLTADHSMVDTQTKPNEIYVPTPARAHRLMLSSLGGWLDAEGAWDHRPEELIDMVAWRHRSTMGRDHYVRVIEAGYLFPFRHAAVRITVTERRFHSHQGRRVAFLRTRQFVVVRQPVVTYPEADTPEGRRFPFRRIEALTLVTPNLDPTNAPPSAVPPPVPDTWSDGDVFWPMVNSEAFPFRFVAEDLAGRRIGFSTPVIFATSKWAKGAKNEVDAISFEYGPPEDPGTEKEKGRRTPNLRGQTVRYAQSSTPGDTDFETESISFTGGYALRPKGEPNFRPAFQQTSIRIPAVQRLLGDDEPVALRFPKKYEDAGLAGANAGEVFLEAVTGAPGTAKEIEFAAKGKADSTGGLISPDFRLAGLSRIHGPVGGANVNNIIAGDFKPVDFFPDATLFGGLPLHEIVVKAPAGPPPTFTVAETPSGSTTTYSWVTSEFSKDHDLFIPKAGAELSITTTIETGPTGPPKATTEAHLKKFDINLFGFVTIPFDQVSFLALPGKKPEVDVGLAGRVAFGGPLVFVNTLREYIPASGFSDPPDLAVTDAGITATYDVELPNIVVGIFSLENMSLGAGFVLPFDDREMTVQFNFAERHDTFTITVAAFGGGGFLALELAAKGPVFIEGALEFGGKLALDIGVASGGVYVKAGIYFAWALDQATGNEAVTLAGYVEVGGSLSVLGLISVSVVFHLALTYTDKGKVWGEATLYVEVEVAWVSKTVTMTVRKEFAGSAGDPSFAELMPSQDAWDAYCNAFAQEAV